VTTINPKTVTRLYDLASITPLIGIEDYTDGMYNGNIFLNYHQAQKNQHNYLLDEIGVRKGFRLLDVGCGLGTLLETARERGVEGTGITISGSQVDICRAKGLDVHLLNYKNLPQEWCGKFDGIIANGSLEHFCQPEDASAGKQDQIYREMFQIFSRLLSDNFKPQRVATTAIHFRGEAIEPKMMLKNPLAQLFDNENLHFSILHRGYGGYYPVRGQLESCAKNNFILVNEQDGTDDYRLTSEHWNKLLKKGLRNYQVQTAIFKYFMKRPFHTFWLVASQIGFESWPWQFRGENPRTVLYRQTWEKR